MLANITYYTVHCSKKVVVIIKNKGNEYIYSVDDIDTKAYEETREIINDAEFTAKILGYELEYRYQ